MSPGSTVQGIGRPLGQGTAAAAVKTRLPPLTFRYYTTVYSVLPLRNAASAVNIQQQPQHEYIRAVPVDDGHGNCCPIRLFGRHCRR